MEERLSIKSILDWRHAKLQSGMLQNCFLALPTDSDIYQDLAGFMNLTAENTKTCITSTFDQLTGLFKASKALTEMMSGTTFSMEEIERRKQRFFWLYPMKRQRIIFWQRCLFRSVMKVCWIRRMYAKENFRYVSILFWKNSAICRSWMTLCRC